ncbi:MAG: hypothetical protein U0T74_09365 [Chitinophagales bacterium]
MKKYTAKMTLTTLLVVLFCQTTIAQESEQLTLTGKVNSIAFYPPTADVPPGISGHTVSFTDQNGKARNQGIDKATFDKLQEALETKTLDKITVHYYAKHETVEVVLKK